LYYQILIALAKIEGVKFGLGRVAYIDENNLELGGMYVLDQFRRMGIAEKVILHLLKNHEQHKKIWCLPFKHLQRFYTGFGFLDKKNTITKFQIKYMLNTNSVIKTIIRVCIY
jgi:GNAT superfamily N-acetyltransferase